MTGLHRRLYSDDTASAAQLVASLLLVVAQTAVVFEVVRHLHPAWHWSLCLAAAVGYELATFATGLVVAVRGWTTVLRVGLTVFALVSSWMGFDSVMRSQIGAVAMRGDYTLLVLQQADPILWIRAILTGAALPLQYLLAVAAGRQLGANKTTPAESPEGTAEGDKTGLDSASTSGDSEPQKVPPLRPEPDVRPLNAKPTRRKPSLEERAEWHRLASGGMTPGQISKARQWAESTVRDEIQRAA